MQRILIKHLGNERGVTLLELIVTSLIMTMIIGTVVIFNVVWARSWSKGAFLSEAQNSVSLCMDRIMRDIRPATGVINVTATEITVKVNNYDTNIEEEIRFYRDSSTNELKKAVTPDGSGTTTTTVVGTAIEALSFSYDSTDREVTCVIDSVDKNGLDFTLSGSVRMRNAH